MTWITTVLVDPAEGGYESNMTMLGGVANETVLQVMATK